MLIRFDGQVLQPEDIQPTRFTLGQMAAALTDEQVEEIGLTPVLQKLAVHLDKRGWAGIRFHDISFSYFGYRGLADIEQPLRGHLRSPKPQDTEDANKMERRTR